MKKVCKKCKKPKDKRCFNKNKRAKDGLNYHCKMCEKKIQNNFRSKKQNEMPIL